jgi:hypothetical protein
VIGRIIDLTATASPGEATHWTEAAMAEMVCDGRHGYRVALGDRLCRRLGRPQIGSVLRVKNMVEIVLGALVVIGVFVFWCDVTDSWKNVLFRYKTGKR